MTHPITVPLELVEEWGHDANLSGVPYNDEHWAYEQHIATRAAQWGADQELLACGNYLKQCAAWEEEDVIEFYNYRRPEPKPYSLKEQALSDLTHAYNADKIDDTTFENLRRALEQLPDNE
jgi:hypothetical protein